MFNGSLFLPIVGFVNGVEGARNYPMTANQTAYLFDQEKDSFYVKATDLRGMVSCFKEYAYSEVEVEEPKNESPYVTKAEMEELFEKYFKIGRENDNGKHSVSTNEQRFSKPAKSVQN